MSTSSAIGADLALGRVAGEGLVLDLDFNRLLDGVKTARMSSAAARVLARFAQDGGCWLTLDDLALVMSPGVAAPRGTAQELLRHVRRALARMGFAGAIELKWNVGYRLTVPVQVIVRVPVYLSSDQLSLFLPAIAARKPLPPRRLA